MTNIANWKDPPFLMGKSTISTGPFSIAMLVITRGYPVNMVIFHISAQFRASPDEVRGRLSKLLRRFNQFTFYEVSLFAYLLTGEWSEKTFQKLNSYFWLSGRSGNAPFKSGGEKKISLRKVFSHTFRHIAVAPQHLAEG